MIGRGKYFKAQLAGLRDLPDQSGAWGILLPRGKEPAIHEPDARDQVQDINPAFLTFIDSEMNVDRGMWIVLSAFTLSYMLVLAFIFGPKAMGAGIPIWFTVPVVIIFIVFIVGPAVGIYFWVNSPVPPPVILSRKSRQIYAWRGKSLGWRVFNYDDVHPFIYRAQLISTAGATTIYTPQIAILDVNRKIVDAVVVAPPSRLPSVCGMNWEFIRRYMDDVPEKVPPVLAQPPVNDKRAMLARIDQIGFSGLVGRDFKLESSLFAWCYYYFHGVIGYWWFRSAAWLQCRGKYPEYSMEMRRAMAFEGVNPYRKEPLSTLEQDAFSGKLPRLRFRWAIIGSLSTFLWGGLWLLIAAPFLFT